jgi:hypothetical protein
MSEPPLPGAAVAMLRKPNPPVMTTLRRDGQPVSTATWYPRVAPSPAKCATDLHASS